MSAHPIFARMFDDMAALGLLPPITPPAPLPELTPEQLAEGDTTEIRR